MTIREEENIAGALCDFYSPDDVQMWLDTPHPLLSQDTPRQAIARGDCDKVLAIVEQLKTGAYA